MADSQGNRIKEIEALRPVIKDQHHQDSLFGNSFQAKSFFVVHPEWISETVDNTDPEPLHRPPWPWEQPRYRQNIQNPIQSRPDTSSPEKPEENGDKNASDVSLTNGVTNDDMCDFSRMTSGDTLPVPYTLPIGYTFTHPSIDDTKPYDKQTRFGAPVVDTTIYRVG